MTNTHADKLNETLETAEDQLDMAVTALRLVLGDSGVVEMVADGLISVREALIDAERCRESHDKARKLGIMALKAARKLRVEVEKLKALDAVEHREDGQYKYCPACGLNVTDAECDCY